MPPAGVRPVGRGNITASSSTALYNATSTKSSNGKHITFDRQGPRVTMVAAPAQEERPGLWFTESEKVVAKPLVFTVPPHEKISINIGVQVELMSIGASGPVNAQNKRGPTTTLMVCGNDDGAATDSLDDRLRALTGKQKRPRSASKQLPWFSCGTVRAGTLEKIHVVLPRGEYVLRCIGEQGITVFGQAADVERHLA